MSYTARIAVAKLIYMLAEKQLRQGFCACHRPLEKFIDKRIQKAMDDVEAALAED